MKNVLKKTVAFGLVMFLLITAVMATQIPIQVASPEKLSVVWDVTLNFIESGGKSDYVIFGESDDANDGEPPDIYDEPKPPAPFPPYLRAWFDDDLPTPYHDLWEDYRMYPDAEKVWDLYVRWVTSDGTPIDITISWDISEFIGIEYEYVTLNRYNISTEEWDFAADMLTENYYTYAPEYYMEQWIMDHFQINAYINSPPYVPSSPVPINSAIDVDVDGDLSWFGGDPDPDDTVTYDVYFGTTSSPPQVAWNQSDTMYDPGTMNYNIQYFWKIVAWDNHDISAEGPIWNFTTQAQPNDPPYMPSNPLPINHATKIDINIDLSWFGGDPDPDDTVTYDVYFGTTSSPPQVAWNQSDTMYDPGTMNYNIQYFWKIVAWDNHNTCTIGPIWDFTTEELFIGWECYFDFTDPAGGYDNVFFGEKIDASNSQDIYDVPKSPPGMTPYIRAWFDTSFPDPHNRLLKEYKQYPDDYKIWNLTVQWMPDDYTSPTNITISWNSSCLNTVEYNSTRLKNTASGETVNMLSNENYTFNATALTAHHFQIICSNELHITNLKSKWNLISLPFNQFIHNDNITVRYDGVDYSWENATTGNNPTGASIVLGYIYSWNTSVPHHYALSDVFEPGYGYWMYAYHDCKLLIEDFDSMINNGHITDLLTTWNLMGSPNDVSLPKEEIIVRYDGVDYSWENATTGNNPTGASIVLGYIYSWNTSVPQHYALSDVFEPGYGYWMYAYHDCTLRMEIFVPIIIDNSPVTAGTGNNFVFNASVSDSDGIDSVLVEYWFGVDTHINDVLTSTGVGDYYEKAIMIPSDSVDSLYYVISANDSFDVWSNTIETSVVVVDDELPEISGVLASPSSVSQGGFVNITCNVIDNVGVDVVMVNISGPAGFTPLNTSISSYYNSSYDIVGTYDFFIWANDAGGNSNTSDMYTFSIIVSLLLVDSEINNDTDGVNLISDDHDQNWYESHDDDPTTITIQHVDNNVDESLSNEDHSYLIDVNMLDSIWDVTLEFNEPDGGYDNVFFGEKIDASNSQDIYDVPKSPPGMTPYIRAWFDTSFPDPHNRLLKEYKQYPDDYKIWNLTVQWMSGTSTDVTISWNPSNFGACEYTSIDLYDVAADSVVADMLVDSEYTYPASPYAVKSFQIICSITNESPGFSDENPLDGSVDVLLTTSQLTVTIVDIEGDTFDWTIETSPDIGISSGTGESNGVKICSISGLEYGTTYTWYVNATDSGSESTTVYTFTTEEETGIEIDSISGGLGVSAVITNTGNIDATDVEWGVTITGGMFGLIDKEFNGTISILAVDDSITVKSGIFFGIGVISITVIAGCVEETIDGKQLIIFTKIMDDET